MKLTDEEKANLDDDLRLAPVINGVQQFCFLDTPSNAARKHGHLVFQSAGLVKVTFIGNMVRVIVL